MTLAATSLPTVQDIISSAVDGTRCPSSETKDYCTPWIY